jgi:hypothetical protein
MINHFFPNPKCSHVFRKWNEEHDTTPLGSHIFCYNRGYKHGNSLDWALLNKLKAAAE